MVKTCPICGQEFVLHHSTQKYCSPECNYKARCARKKSHYEQNHVQIYDQQCRTFPGFPPSSLRVVSCQRCGKKFKETFHNDHFCSDECRFKFYGPLKINAITLVCGKLLD